MKNFCIIPFTSMLVRADSTASCCCMNSGTATLKNGEPVFLYRDSLEEAFQSPYIKELRRSMLADERHPSCATCWNQEDAGIVSKRQADNVILKHWVDKVLAGEPPTAPIDLSLNLGTLCNLKCRICGSSSSSRWPQEYLDLFGVDHLPRNNEMIRSMSPEESRALSVNWPYRDPRFTETMMNWLPMVDRMEFLGGEPFLNQKQFEIVKKSVELGCAKKQELLFVTNGTIFPEEAAKEQWPHFRKVCINVSVDGLGRQFDYQRFGANWEKVCANIERYRSLESVTLVHVYVSISLFTAYYLPEIFAHWAKLGVMNFISFVAQPDRFDVRSLPKVLKQRISAKFAAAKSSLPELPRSYLDQVEAYMNSADQEVLWPKALESIWFHDGYRKQSFAEVFPEFHREAKEAGVWWDYATQKEYFFPAEAKL